MNLLFLCFVRLLQKRIEDLRKQRKTVEDQIATAEDKLQKTVDLIKELSEGKMVRFEDLFIFLLFSTWNFTCNFQLLTTHL